MKTDSSVSVVPSLRDGETINWVSTPRKSKGLFR
jgi:hypothetical protein